MKAMPENVFVGAKVIINKKEITIIKINAKSFYGCECSFTDFLEKQENAKKYKITFKNLCGREGWKQYKYETAELAEGQKKPEIENKNKFLFSKTNRLLLEDCYRRMVKNETKRGSINNGDCQITICTRKDNILMLSYDTNFYFYNMENHSDKFIASVFEQGINESNVWERLSA